MDEGSDPRDGIRGIDRRTFLRYGAYTGALAAASQAAPSFTGSAAAAATLGPHSTVAATRKVAGSRTPRSFPFEEKTIAELQAMMESGQITSRELTQAYIDRIDQIDQNGIRLNSVMEINSDALAIADRLDQERQHGHVRGPLHGIPVLLKDNIGTADRMQTTAGSLALLGSIVPRDAFTAGGLRKAGAVLMGKTNLSEWANFRSFQSSSGWSGRAGQCLNPYVLDHNPCGSSSGSGSAVSANLAAAALGTETDGSIVCPSSTTGLAGIKPTLGLTSRSGVIPIAHSQDVVGPMARTVADAATVLGALTGIDPRDPATFKSRGHFFNDYRPFLNAQALRGARIGVWRDGVFGFSPEGDAVAEEAIQAMKELGATVIDPVEIPGVFDVFDAELTVLTFEFKVDVRKYLLDLKNTQMRSLADLIAFDDAHADTEMPWFGQELFLVAEDTDGLHDPVYLDALKLEKSLMIGGIRSTLQSNDLDAIFSLTGSPSWTTDLVNGDHFLTASSWPPAIAGFPNVTVPAGYSFKELPVGINFFADAWSEPTLIGLAYSFEQGTKVRHAPKFLETLGTHDFVPRAARRGRKTAGVGTGSGSVADVRRPARRLPTSL
jgi:amidase